MANYSLVINSRFRPFEYQELLAPALMATQAHQAVEEAYADLSAKASIWDKMANEATDPKAHAMYKKYADDLQSYSDQLAQNGLTPTSRQAMLNMRSRYAQDIVPIETAYKRREADIAAQKEIMLKDPTHLFNRRASEVSLDEYLGNQNLDVLSDNYSKELLTKQVSQAAANLKQTLMKKGAPTALGLPYQYERMIQYGASADDVLAAMSRDPKAMPTLTKLVEDVMAASGIRKWSSMNGDWANNPTYKEAEAAAMRGLYSAIGTSKIDHFTDSFNMQDQLSARQHTRAVAEQQRQQRQTTRLNPLPLRSSQEISKVKKEVDTWLKAGYFTKDSNGRYIMTPKGFEEMRRTYHNPGTKAYAGSSGYYKPQHTAFYKFMVGLNGGKPFLSDSGAVLPGWGPARAGNLFSAYVAQNQEGNYDTFHSTEYDRQLGSSYGKEVATQLWTAAGTKDGQKVLIPVDFNGKDGWKQGEALTSKDLEGYHVSNIRYSKWGNTAILSKDGADPIRVKLPKGIHLGSEKNVATAIRNADDYGIVLSVGKRPSTITLPTGGIDFKRDRAGNIIFTNEPLTESDRTILSQYQTDALDEMGQYGAQLVVPSKTKEEELTPFNF